MPPRNDFSLQQAIELAHEFGHEQFVRGCGGNISVKNDDILWIKPSANPMDTLRADQLVPVVRKKMSDYYQYIPTNDWLTRENDLKNILANAIAQGHPGRPSVETALHDSLPQKFVVHLQPALVNGLTCARDGLDHIKKHFPEAVWIAATEPGYHLCMAIRKESQQYRKNTKKDAELFFLQNQGLVVAAETPENLMHIVHQVVRRIHDIVTHRDEMPSDPPAQEPNPDEYECFANNIEKILGERASAVIPYAYFDLPEGPFIPDHIVYMHGYVYRGMPTPEGLENFERKYGFLPVIFSTGNAIYSVEKTHKAAILAMEFLQDAALIEKYTRTFGGPVYLDENFARFVVHWDQFSYHKH